jgi:hypothetical protein
MVNICAKVYWNPYMHVEVLLRTIVLLGPLSVTLTFNLQTWFMRMTLLLIVVYRSGKETKTESFVCMPYTLVCICISCFFKYLFNFSKTVNLLTQNYPIYDLETTVLW